MSSFENSWESLDKSRNPDMYETQKTEDGDKVGLFSLDIKGAHMILRPQLN